MLDDSTGFNPNRSELKKPLIILMSMAGLLVCMCAINVATLLLLRAAGRAREMSMRYALGAKRSRIVSQLLVEGGLLGLAGAAVGLALAPVVATTLVRLMTSSDPGTEPYSASIDTRVLLFTLAISIVGSLLFSIAPVFHFLRPDLAQALRQNTGTASKSSQRFRKVGRRRADCAQRPAARRRGPVSCARSTTSAISRSASRPLNLVTFSLDPTSSGYGEDRTPQIVTSALDALRRIPGVVAVAATSDPELAGDSERRISPSRDTSRQKTKSMNFEEPCDHARLLRRASSAHSCRPGIHIRRRQGAARR